MRSQFVVSITGMRPAVLLPVLLQLYNIIMATTAMAVMAFMFLECMQCLLLAALCAAIKVLIFLNGGVIKQCFKQIIF